MSGLVALLLAVGVSTAWLAAAGCLVLPNALDRLHAVTFLSLTSGTAVALAAALTDGFTDRLLKTIFILLALWIGGAGMTHLLGQAILRRAEAPGENGDA